MYRVVTYSEASDQIAELPPHLLLDYARALDAVAAASWDGAPHNSNNPDAEVRRWLFRALGVGQVLSLVLDASARFTCCGLSGWSCRTTDLKPAPVKGVPPPQASRTSANAEVMGDSASAPFLAIAELLWNRATNFGTWWDALPRYHRDYRVA